MSLPGLKIGNVTSKYPIIQGGMGVGISLSNLSSAVSEAGGIGIIASVALGINSRFFTGPPSYREANKQALADELSKAFALSDKGNIGTNCMVALTDFENMVRTSLESGARLIISGAGLPMILPEYARDFPDVALVPIVSSKKAAKLIFRRWEKNYKRIPDALVVETPNYAGGHLGSVRSGVGKEEFLLERVIPELREYLNVEMGINIPVIAAGGIWDRDDIDRMISIGADGVQMATRFICTYECDAPDEFKNAILKAGEADVVLVDSPVGLPGRGVRNDFVRSLEEGTFQGDGKCFVNCLRRCSYRDRGEGFCIATALINAQKGDLREGLVFSGSNVGRCIRMVSVRDVFRELTGE